MKPSPLQVFQACAEARGYLFGAGEYANADAAIAPLMNDAWHAGLIDRFGTKTLMEIIDAAFAPFWESE
jgi:hypothetical protein